MPKQELFWCHRCERFLPFEEVKWRERCPKCGADHAEAVRRRDPEFQARQKWLEEAERRQHEEYMKQLRERSSAEEELPRRFEEDRKLFEMSLVEEQRLHLDAIGRNQLEKGGKFPEEPWAEEHLQQLSEGPGLRRLEEDTEAFLKSWEEGHQRRLEAEMIELLRKARSPFQGPLDAESERRLRSQAQEALRKMLANMRMNPGETPSGTGSGQSSEGSGE